MALVAEARDRGLPLMAKALDEAALPEPAERDPALLAPEPTELPYILERMCRRGVEPLQLLKMLEGFAGARPVETGLASWDLLCNSICSSEPNDKLILTMGRNVSERIDAVLPAPGASFVNTRVLGTTAIIEKLTSDLYARRSAAELEQLVAQRDLAALEELRRRGGMDQRRHNAIAEGTRQFARILHLAHLPTLASFYFDYLFRAWDYRPALADLVEVLLEEGATESLPPPADFIRDGTPAEVELLGYVQARIRLINKDHRALYDELKRQPSQIDYKRPPDEVAATLQRNHLVMAEVALDFNELPVPFEVIDRVARQDRMWRYAAQVRAAMISKISPASSSEPLIALDSFVGAFGNRFRLWYLMARYAPTGNKSWLPGLHRRLIREAHYLPHDYHAWAGMAAILDPEGLDPLLDELKQRVAWQCVKPTSAA